MNSWLSLFSDWTLALLPRLFLYPGGLWALVMLMALRFLSGGMPSLGLRTIAADMSRSQPAIALAWVALALLPLPAAAVLPFPADRFSLAGLLVSSLMLSWRSGDLAPAHVSSGIAVTLAVMAPLAGGHALMQTGAEWGIAGWLSLAAVVAGLSALSASAQSLATGVRWLAWFGLGAAPIWAGWAPAIVPGPVWASLVYLITVVALASAGRRGYIRRNQRVLLAMCWGLGALSLLLALAFGAAH